MEDEVLLHMYKKSWDAFLEAYKEKVDQVKKLEEIARGLIENSENVEEAKELEKEIDNIVRGI